MWKINPGVLKLRLTFEIIGFIILHPAGYKNFIMNENGRKGISRKQFFTIAATSGAALACNLPAILAEGGRQTVTPTFTSTVTETVTPTGARLATTTLTITPELRVEGDTPEAMLKNFFEQVLGVEPVQTEDGSLKFVKKDTGEVFHVDTVDMQECIEGFDVSRINLSLKGEACGIQPQSTPESAAPTSPHRKNTPQFNPSSTPVRPESTVTRAPTQPPQATRTPGGSGATPIVNTPVNTPKPTEQIQPTFPPPSEPSSTPGF